MNRRSSPSLPPSIHSTPSPLSITPNLPRTHQPAKVPQGAAGLFLLGRLCHKAHRPKHALAYYRLALHLDAALWGAYDALCRLDPRLAGLAPGAGMTGGLGWARIGGSWAVWFYVRG